jgi:hypothetical protein
LNAQPTPNVSPRSPNPFGKILAIFRCSSIEWQLAAVSISTPVWFLGNPYKISFQREKRRRPKFYWSSINLYYSHSKYR